MGDSVFNIPQNIHSVKGVRAVFEDSGIPVAEWARAKGFSTSLVYQVLEGRRKCLRGQSHQIAVALGIKQGSIVSVQELIARLG
ncbi:DNA-binding protein [Dechloromonas denitrificans]|uniref:DNA-binding protein n=1 Tax=Dechloromonas denitrificans TaxID=281362 RepID=UPI001CFA39CC|nr:DNA-binding protein [Dechloromonas denitrificans]